MLTNYVMEQLACLKANNPLLQIEKEFFLIRPALSRAKLTDNWALILEKVCRLLWAYEVQVILVVLLSHKPYIESVINETVKFEIFILLINAGEYRITSLYPLIK